MSRLYDTIEPSVIDDEMLHKAVEEQGPKEEAGKIAKQEGIDFADVESLRLDYKNILKIDNLWCFTTLRKLQLDNNIIEKIEGLHQLVNLEWLDLSFNNIDMIEGLDKLTNLRDLTLYNNRIATIENMDTLTQLHVLSLGNNDLDKLENLLYLRRFKRLRTLNLAGNPFCDSTDPDYKSYVVAFLPHLEYLDYRLIDEDTKEAAEKKFDVAIEELLHDERVTDRKQEEVEEHALQLQLHTAAFVERMDGPDLFDSLYSEDVEGQKLNTMPSVDELMAEYGKKFTEICRGIFDTGLSKHEERATEVNEFWNSINEAKTENKKEAMDFITQFLEHKKQLFVELQGDQDPQVIETKVAAYNTKVTEVWDKLMGLELQLVDQLEEAVKEFERNLSDMVGAFIEKVQGYFSQCRDLENQHHERILEISMITLEKAIKNELDEEVSEDLRMLMVDKDTVINAVTSSHDIHLLKIDNREDDIITRINAWMKGLIDSIHDEEEVQRNRARVAEITHFIDNLRDEVDNLDLHQY
ncbi:dynein regulatory complex subunit 3-like [Watersipora subatra]|uniref:dynein regulatory complex subunit 3-like n=1 Tax=Watersipora subatra TaxID=2589382 RepID=UPI00355C0238